MSFSENIKPFLCEECREPFVSASELNCHCTENSHTSEVKAMCFICQETLSHADKTLRMHIYSNHLGLKPFKCKFCTFTSYTKHKIGAIHLKKHHGNIDWSQDDIEFLQDVMQMIDDFERKHSLQIGMPMIEKLKSGKMFKTSRKRQKDSLQKAFHKPYMCDECGKTFQAVTQLKRHVDDFLHTSKETAVCFECGDVLETRVAFRIHLWMHNNFKPYKCKRCNFTTTKKEHIYTPVS